MPLYVHRAVQEVGGAGMLLWNTDESLIPLMTEKKEIAGLRIWGATYVRTCRLKSALMVLCCVLS